MTPKPRVKTEGKKVGCVAGADDLASKKASNDFQAKLKRAPLPIREFYEGNFKMQKLTNPDKKAFVENVLATTDFKCEYFDRTIDNKSRLKCVARNQQHVHEPFHEHTVTNTFIFLLYNLNTCL